jgi:hypothetical protein
MNQLDNLDLLFLRLKDPSGLVRERACMSISTLLLSEDSKEVESRLLNWMNLQTLESLAALGLLVFLRAKITKSDYQLPGFAIFDRSILKRSIYSYLLLKRISNTAKLNVQNMHSSSAPETYSGDPFFEQYKQYAALPWCVYALDKIEQLYNEPARKQWSFEFQAIQKANGVRLSINPLYYCGRSDSEHFKIFSPLLSEVYLSSYLRTLAWLISKGLPEEEIIRLAAKTFPVNLDFWKVEPNPKPAYWSTAYSEKNQPIIACKIMSEAEALVKKVMAPSQTLIEAAGRLFEGTVVFDINIFGFFVKSVGSLPPTCQELLSWLFNPDVEEYNTDLLSFEGKLEPKNAEKQQVSINDWVAYPAVSQVIPNTFCPWQFWRLARGIYVPSSILLEKPCSIECNTHAIAFREDKEVIAEWIDWTDGLTEKASANLPPSTGNMLTLNTNVVERFRKRTASKLYWGCCLTKFERESRYENYKISNDFTIFNGDGWNYYTNIENKTSPCNELKKNTD